MIRRLWALVRKEMLQIVRDPSSIVIALVLPVVLLLLFGYGVSLDARHVTLAVVVPEPTPRTASLVSAFANSPYFRVEELRFRQPAEAGLVAGRYRGVVLVAEDFDAKAARNAEAPIQVLLDGTDANTARLVKGYAEGVWAVWLGHEARDAGQRLGVPVTAETRVWFNEALESRNFLVPGLIAINMTLVGTILTALVVAREWERGTMEAMIATPVGAVELLVGKLLPYFVLGMGGMALSVLLALYLFHVPLRGSLWVLVAVSALFLVGALNMGLLISTVARNQFVAGQIAIVSAFLPAFMLSGFVFEPSSMPLWIEALSHVVAARYFVTCLQTIFMAGDVWSVILPNAGALLLIAAILGGLTLRRTKKSLE
ncbi:MAG: ABC transporter permease [Magnetospirillum sp.]|nr:ABC transporter permease [Magnetospirillum sp.]